MRAVHEAVDVCIKERRLGRTLRGKPRRARAGRVQEQAVAWASDKREQQQQQKQAGCQSRCGCGSECKLEGVQVVVRMRVRVLM